MLTLFKISLLFSLFLPSVYSVCQNIPYGDVPGDQFLNFTHETAATDVAILPRLPLGCTDNSDAGRYNVYVSGRVTITNTQSDNTPIHTFDVFNVDINDISTRSVAYRYDQLTDIGLKNCIVRAFDDYYPREKMAEGSFNPTKFLVVTWTVTQSILSSGGNEISDSNSPLNIFQLVYAHEGKRALIFYNYRNIRWGTGMATVGLRACGDSLSGRWNNPLTPQELADESNVPGRRGEWLFYLNGTGHLTPAVNCRSGCSLTNGYCTEKDTCTCREGWTGDTCIIPVCCQGCVNGTCTSPDTCECNEGWLGDSCDEARCYSDCINGRCVIPDVCSCREGFEGKNCTKPVCSQDCSPYGFCTRPNHCSCIVGYTGGSSPCTPICDDECLNGGSCTAPNSCTCPSGFTGPRCNTTIVSTSTVVTMMESPSPTVTEPTTDPTDGTTTTPDSQLSSSTIGAITGGIIALVVIVIIIVVIIIVAVISC